MVATTSLFNCVTHPQIRKDEENLLKRKHKHEWESGLENKFYLSGFTFESNVVNLTNITTETPGEMQCDIGHALEFCVPVTNTPIGSERLELTSRISEVDIVN